MAKFYLPKEDLTIEAEDTADVETKLQEKEKKFKKSKVNTEENNG